MAGLVGWGGLRVRMRHLLNFPVAKEEFLMSAPLKTHKAVLS